MEGVALRALGGCCAALTLSLLVLGLWPFGAPNNAVAWLAGRNGLRLGPRGVVFGTRPVTAPTAAASPECSVELWVEPALITRPGTLLAFYAADRITRLRLRQSLSDLAIHLEQAGRPVRRAQLYIDAFRQGAARFIAVTSGAEGTSVYLDGVLARSSNAIRIPGSACSGRLVLGDSPRESDAWQGKVFGAAVYSRQLGAPAVARHYQTWTRLGRPDVTADESLAALFAFDEHSGSTVRNGVPGGAGLAIPPRYMLLDPVFLETPWSAFHMSWSYWQDVFENILGFIPFGFCVRAYLSMVRRMSRAGLATLICGCLLTFTIESLQVFLPTRDSDMTDVLTNTAGTLLGMALFAAAATAFPSNETGTIGQPREG